MNDACRCTSLYQSYLPLVKHLYAWSDQQITEQAQDSQVLRWFFRLGTQSAPIESPVSLLVDQVPATELETLWRIE